jgi:hypothetical protein
MPTLQLPRRSGPRPSTTPSNPHPQLDQQPGDPLLVEELGRRGIVERPSRISVPGPGALTLLDVVERRVRASHAFARPA